MAPAYDAAILRLALPVMIRASPRLLESGRFFVAFAPDGSAVGCGGWSLETPGTAEIAPGVGHVRHFAVHPDWTGKGVGRGIYDACERQAAAEGVARFEVFASLNSVPFYARLGFSNIGEINIAIGSGAMLPSVWMQRTIER